MLIALLFCDATCASLKFAVTFAMLLAGRLTVFATSLTAISQIVDIAPSMLLASLAFFGLVNFTKHLTAEIEVESMVKGVLRRSFRPRHGRNPANHYLDASYLADVAAAMKGIRLLGDSKPSVPPPAERPSARDLAGRK